MGKKCDYDDYEYDDFHGKDKDYDDGYRDGFIIGYETQGQELGPYDKRSEDESSSYSEGFGRGHRDGTHEDKHRFDD